MSEWSVGTVSVHAFPRVATGDARGAGRGRVQGQKTQACGWQVEGLADAGGPQTKRLCSYVINRPVGPCLPLQAPHAYSYAAGGTWHLRACTARRKPARISAYPAIDRYCAIQHSTARVQAYSVTVRDGPWGSGVEGQSACLHWGRHAAAEASRCTCSQPPGAPLPHRRMKYCINGSSSLYDDSVLQGRCQAAAIGQSTCEHPQAAQLTQPAHARPPLPVDPWGPAPCDPRDRHTGGIMPKAVCTAYGTGMDPGALTPTGRTPQVLALPRLSALS